MKGFLPQMLPKLGTDMCFVSYCILSGWESCVRLQPGPTCGDTSHWGLLGEAVWWESGEAHCLEEVGRCLAALPLDCSSSEFLMPSWCLTMLTWWHQVHQTSFSEVTTQVNEWASPVSSIVATFASANPAAVEIPSPGPGSHHSFPLRVLISLSVSRFPLGWAVNLPLRNGMHL